MGEKVLKELSGLGCIERFVWLVYETRPAMSLEDRYITDTDLRIVNQNLNFLEKYNIEYLGYDGQDNGGAGYIFQKKGWNKKLKESHPDFGDVKTAGIFYGHPECCSQQFKETCIKLEEEHGEDYPLAFIKFLVDKKSRMVEAINGNGGSYKYLLLLDCIPCKTDCEEFKRLSEKLYADLIDFDGKNFADSVVEKYKNKVSASIYNLALKTIS